MINLKNAKHRAVNNGLLEIVSAEENTKGAIVHSCNLSVNSGSVAKLLINNNILSQTTGRSDGCLSVDVVNVLVPAGHPVSLHADGVSAHINCHYEVY